MCKDDEHVLDVSTAAARAINNQQRAHKAGTATANHPHHHHHHDNHDGNRERMRGESVWGVVKERLDLRRDPVRTVIEETLLLGDTLLHPHSLTRPHTLIHPIIRLIAHPLIHSLL